MHQPPAASCDGSEAVAISRGAPVVDALLDEVIDLRGEHRLLPSAASGVEVVT